MVSNQCLRLDKREHLVSFDSSLYKRTKASYDKRRLNNNPVFLYRLTAQEKLRARALGKLIPAGPRVAVHGRRNPSTMKKYLADGVAFVHGGADEPLGALPSVQLVSRCSDNQREYHGADTKSPGDAGAFTNRNVCSVIAAGEHGNQVQQMDKQVENIEIQPHRRPNVVSLATLNNAAGIKQYQTGHYHNDHCRNSDR
jgi:hypothetical protein